MPALAVRTSTSVRSTPTAPTNASTASGRSSTTSASSRRHKRFTAGAVIEPAIAYANLMVPGQQLAVHTDVPEFRGANRKLVPQWLLVVMHHSGLFDEHRMPIANAIAWFHDCDGGELAYWPDGPDGAARASPVQFNTGMVLDTDSVFHGVDRIADVAADDCRRSGPARRSTTSARHVGTPDGRGRRNRRYGWNELRFSVSWKAYCFVDEHERDSWRDHTDDLTIDVILDRLIDDLAERGRVPAISSATASSALLLIDEYVRFPANNR